MSAFYVKKKPMYTVDILHSEKFDKNYSGQTGNLNVRLIRHNEGKVRSTNTYRNRFLATWPLLYINKFRSNIHLEHIKHAPVHEHSGLCLQSDMHEYHYATNPCLARKM